MSIETREGDIWLICDICPDSAARSQFWGVGLETAAHVRFAARDLDGWIRRKTLVSTDPIASKWLDLCPSCKQPEVLSTVLVLHLGAALKACTA